MLQCGLIERDTYNFFGNNSEYCQIIVCLCSYADIELCVCCLRKYRVRIVLKENRDSIRSVRPTSINLLNHPACYV